MIGEPGSDISMAQELALTLLTDNADGGVVPGVILNPAGQSALVTAIAAGIDEVETVLSRKADPDATDDDGFSALALASSEGRIQMVEALLTHHADPNLADPQQSPLHFAAATGNPVLASILLSHNANLNHSEPCTPLRGICMLETAAAGHIAVAEMLLANKADPNAAEEDWLTPLACACYNSLTSIAQLLISYGGDINQVLRQGGENLFVVCCENDQVAVVKLLLSSKAGPNEAHSDGTSALGYPALMKYS